jgi:hypothetical protein
MPNALPEKPPVLAGKVVTFTSRYTHDTILRLREASGIPQMLYFVIFITHHGGPGSDHLSPFRFTTALLMPKFTLWVMSDGARK